MSTERELSESVLAAIEELARNATPGPWEAGDVWVYTGPIYADDRRLADVLGMKFEDEDRQDAERERGLANAAHIAAADPSMVLALISEIRRLRAVFEKAHTPTGLPAFFAPRAPSTTTHIEVHAPTTEDNPAGVQSSRASFCSEECLRRADSTAPRITSQDSAEPIPRVRTRKGRFLMNASNSVMPCTLPNAVPTDDEREALEQVVAPILDAAMGGYSSGTYDDYAITDAVLAAGFRRTVQGEPSPDAQALLADADALVASWDRKGSWSADSPVGMVMQLARALRAAVVSVQGKAPGVEALEAFLSKLAGSGAYTLNFGSANELFEDIVRALRRDIEALRAAASSPVQAPEGEVK